MTAVALLYVALQMSHCYRAATGRYAKAQQGVRLDMQLGAIWATDSPEHPPPFVDRCSGARYLDLELCCVIGIF